MRRITRRLTIRAIVMTVGTATRLTSKAPEGQSATFRVQGLVFFVASIAARFLVTPFFFEPSRGCFPSRLFSLFFFKKNFQFFIFLIFHFLASIAQVLVTFKLNYQFVDRLGRGREVLLGGPFFCCFSSFFFCFFLCQQKKTGKMK